MLGIRGTAEYRIQAVSHSLEYYLFFSPPDILNILFLFPSRCFEFATILLFSIYKEGIGFTNFWTLQSEAPKKTYKTDKDSNYKINQIYNNFLKNIQYRRPPNGSLERKGGKKGALADCLLLAYYGRGGGGDRAAGWRDFPPYTGKKD